LVLEAAERKLKMVNDRIEESRAKVDGAQVEPAKLLEYIGGDKNAAATAGNESNKSLLPAVNWSDQDFSKPALQTGNLQMAGFWERENLRKEYVYNCFDMNPSSWREKCTADGGWRPGYRRPQGLR
jgi:hypothetical protein